MKWMSVRRARAVRFADLQAQIYQQVSMADVNDSIATGGANNVDGLALHNSTGISNPPTTNDLQMVMQMVYALSGALKRPDS
jgi:hypothetical protein